MIADRVMFFPLGHRLRAIALHKDRIVAKQLDSTGEWFANTVAQTQLVRDCFAKLPVAALNRNYINFCLPN